MYQYKPCYLENRVSRLPVVVIQGLSKENLGGQILIQYLSKKKKVLLFFLPKILPKIGKGGLQLPPYPLGYDGSAAYRFNNERQTKFSLDRTKIDDRRQFFSPFVLLYRKDYM